MENRKASWFELFFDLSYVVSVAALTHAFADQPAFSAAQQLILPLIVIFLTWSQATFFSNRFDHDDLFQRLCFFVQMFGVLMMAASAQHLYGTGSTLFVSGVLFTRAGLLVLYARSIMLKQDRAGVGVWLMSVYAATGGLWALSLWASPENLPLVWAAGVAIDVGAPIALALPLSRARNLEAHHLPERFGLFVLLILGESMASIATGLAHGASLEVAGLAGVSFFLVFAIWGFYFDNYDLEAVTRRFRDLLYWEYAHYPLIVALGLLGLALHGSLSHVGSSEQWLSLVGLSLGVTYLSLAVIHSACYFHHRLAFSRVQIGFRLACATLCISLSSLPVSEPVLWIAYSATAVAQIGWELTWT